MLGAWTTRARLKLDEESARYSLGTEEASADAPAASPAADDGTVAAPATAVPPAPAPAPSLACVDVGASAAAGSVSTPRKSPRTPRGNDQRSAACAVL
eukprot:3519767-Prymnesium_polylepis.1